MATRPSRPPNYQLESEVVQELAAVIARSPENALQALADHALVICGAGSAGISIEEIGTFGERFRWEATAGRMKPFLNGTVPRRFSPCGVVMDRKMPLLMAFPERHFGYIEKIGIPFVEVMLEPFFVHGKPVGTIWIGSHEAEKHFDLEDQRLLRSLSTIASIGYQAQRNKTAFAADVQERDSKITRREDERDESRLHANQMRSERDESRKETQLERGAKEDALTENRELLEEKEIRERFVNTLTHDLRTPMTAARLTAQLLERGATDSTVSRSLQRITYNLDRADSMIRDLLDANRLRAGDPISLHISECKVDEIIRSVEENQNQLGRKLEVRRLASDLTVFWDKNAVERILENLVGNATKYGNAGSSVSLTVSIRGEWIDLAVHNVGNPIAKGDAAFIFEHFYRLSSAISGGQKGWGIGLGLVKAFTDAHCGSVEVESSAESGTTFTVSLPRDARG